MELCGVNPCSYAECLHRTRLCVGQSHRMCRQLTDCLFVTHVRPELRSGTAKELIFFAGLGQLDLDAADRFVERVINNGTLVPAECSDSVTRTQEGEISLHHLIKYVR